MTQTLSPYQQAKEKRDAALMRDYYRLSKQHSTLRTVLDILKPKYQLHTDGAFYRIRKRYEDKHGKPEPQ